MVAGDDAWVLDLHWIVVVFFAADDCGGVWSENCFGDVGVLNNDLRVVGNGDGDWMPWLCGVRPSRDFHNS